MIDQIICGDCLEVMPTIPDKSVDMILADLPYGTSECKWDTKLSLDDLWGEFKRITKERSAIVLTAIQPYATDLINSNRDWFKYEWIWEKPTGSNFLNANFSPLRCHENILVFSKASMAFSGHVKMEYIPQKTPGKPYTHIASSGGDYKFHTKKLPTAHNSSGGRYPRSVIKFSGSKERGKHATQKPIALFEYLIRTYTNEGDLVLDPTAGSGTTAIACRKSNRHYICIEKEPEYCAIAEKRVAEML